MLDELIRDIQDKNVPVSNLLRRAKVLTNKLGQPDFLKWINIELDGYGKNKKVPDYRIVRGQLKAWNPYHGWVPVLIGTREVEEIISARGAAQSVSEIEELLISDSPDFMMPFPDHFAAQILKDAPIQTRVSLFIGRASLVGILNTVRNKLLDWVLNLEATDIVEAPKESSADAASAEQGVSSFDVKNSLLAFNGKSIEISKTKNSDPHYLLAVIFKEKERTWAYDEIWEDPYFGRNHTDYNPKKDKNKIYNAAYSVNEKVAKATTVRDFLDITTTTVSINKSYL